MIRTVSPSVAVELHDLVRRSSVPRLRSMTKFTESEYRLPSGPCRGMLFNCAHQPFTRLWFAAVDSGVWNRFIIFAPSQASKSTIGYIAIILYHLFEIGERVIAGLPSLDLVKDKWQDDIEPAIAASRYARYLPRGGRASRGGTPHSIEFTNGAILRFMTGGGKDKSRSAWESRIAVISEVDGMDVAGRASREADPITQIENRLRSHGDRKRMYMECTVTTEEGRTWREWNEGTASEILLPCPHCKVYVLPEEKQMLGWKDADDELTVRERSRFHCNACGKAWSEKQRATANTRCVLVHRGQKVARNGRVTGKAPRTRTLGFHWSAVHNRFQTAADVGVDCWKADRSDDQENAKKALNQFVFARPYKPLIEIDVSLVPSVLTRRMSDLPMNVLPADTMHCAIGVDTGKRFCHWAAIACNSEFAGTVPAYGRFDLAFDQVGIEKSIMLGLRDFRDQIVETGFAVHGDEIMRRPDIVIIDAGWSKHTELINAFCRESNALEMGVQWYPSHGFATTQMVDRRYKSPKKTGPTVIRLGDQYHMMLTGRPIVKALQVNVDHWKTFIQRRLTEPRDTDTAITLFRTDRRSHISFSQHLAAEQRFTEMVKDRGMVVRWTRKAAANHWLDCVVMAAVGCHLDGARIIVEPESNWVTGWTTPVVSQN